MLKETQKQVQQSIQQVNKLLKSKAVYDYMLSLMEIEGFMLKRMPLEAKKREVYDKLRPEIQANDARESMRLSLQLQEKEKTELLTLLKDNRHARYQATMTVLIDYGVYVNAHDFERKLLKTSTLKAYKCGTHRTAHKIPADKIRDYTY